MASASRPLRSYVVKLANVYYEDPAYAPLQRKNRILLITAVLRKTKGPSYTSGDPIVMDAERGCHDFTNAWATMAGIPQSWDDSRYESKYNCTCARVQQYIEAGALDRGIVAYGLAATSADAVWPERYKADHVSIEAQRAARVSEKCSNMYGNCHSCKKAWAVARRIQMRSLDEGETLFIECRVPGCSNSWTYRS